MSSKVAGFPKFNRSTLWIIIIVLIPLIALLNRAGQTPEIEDTPSTVQQFRINDLDFSQQDNNAWVKLPGSGQIYLTVASTRVPKNRVSVPGHQDFHFSIRNDMALTRVVIPAEQAALEVTLDFLKSWLPPVQPEDQVIAAGEVSARLLEGIRLVLQEASGDSIPLSHDPDQYITRVAVPEIGSREQLAFLIAAEIIKQRITGYDIQMSWDHSQSTSYLNINSTIRPEWLGPAAADKIEEIRSGLTALAARTERTADQIHRYQVTMSIYGLPAEFIKQQNRLISGITDQQVNEAILLFGARE